MIQTPEPDREKLKLVRDTVQTFLDRKRRLSTATFWVAGLFELLFFSGMLYFMDFGDRFHWFLFCGFVGVYSPLVTMAWRNSVKMDHLYFRLIRELKYGEG